MGKIKMEATSTGNNGPLDEVQWKHPEWIQRNGLRTDNVLEYFSLSPFYDRSSNNQVLKMQSQYNELHSRGNDLYSELQNMKGLEFVVAIAQDPDLWVIRKQERISPKETRPISTYFVVGENIYMAPAVHTIIQNRILSIALSLNKALGIARNLPTFSPSHGYLYKNDNQLMVSVCNNQKNGGNFTEANKNDENNIGDDSIGQTGKSDVKNKGVINKNLINNTEERQAFFHIDNALNHALSNQTVYLESSLPNSLSVNLNQGNRDGDDLLFQHHENLSQKAHYAQEGDNINILRKKINRQALNKQTYEKT